jgi:hypothetical protein
MGCRYRIRKVGKIKSANSLVDQIYNKAILNNEEQMIRCFFYNSKYIQTLEEAQTKILKNLKAK